jgi:hypothetical protein
MLDTKKLYVTLYKGKILEKSIFFPKPGIYRFHCPVGKLKGQITILPKQDKIMREIASRKKKIEKSAKKTQVWMPKNR